MSWRTVVISSSAKLDYQMGYLIVRNQDVVKIHISEISILMIETTSVSLLFDLPVLTEKQRRDYREFRKYLLKAGFFMMQESVYCKLVQNAGVADVVQESIRKNKPGEGLVQILRVTEKQFAKMEYVVGENKSLVLDTDERLVIL